MRQAEAVDITGEARADYERELRITALDLLLKSPVATKLWQRVCLAAEMREIRDRSAGQRLAMELALLEAARS